MLNKKIVILCGGSGSASLLKGLKKFPVDIITIVTVADDGKSTGILREDFDIPAIGDLNKVICNLSDSTPILEKLLLYRYKNENYLKGHSVGNLILTALIDIDGSLSDAVLDLSKVLNVKGKILPFTNDSVTLVATMDDGSVVYGEHNITDACKKIKNIRYKEQVHVLPDAINAIKEADLIIYGIGSLYTSILPTILSDDIRTAIINSNAKKMYISNLMTQHGETDSYKVSDCVKVINEYMGGSYLDSVITSTSMLPSSTLERYKNEENSYPMEVDVDNLKKMGLQVIESDIGVVEDDLIRHDSMKTAFEVFSYLMR